MEETEDISDFGGANQLPHPLSFQSLPSLFFEESSACKKK